MKQAACVLFLLAGSAWGQSTPTPRGFGELFNQAPPHIDQALRERVQQFYKFHQDKKWRAADQLVHEDAKDIFFMGDKITFRDFKIVGVTYEENFTFARVVVDIDTDMFFPGFGQMKVNRPLSSTWKLDKDQWWWHAVPFDPSVGKNSPFNQMFKGSQAGGAEPVDPKAAVLGTPQSMEDFKRVISELKNRVTVDKSEFVFPSNEPAQGEIIVSNRWDGPVHLSIDLPDFPGLSLRIDQPVLAAGKTASVKILSRPETRGAKPSVVARLTVEEISKVVPIQITYLPPPNTEPKPGTILRPAPLPAASPKQ